MEDRVESRRRDRAAAMKMVYEWSMGGDGGEDTLRLIEEADGALPEGGDEPIDASRLARVNELVQGVLGRVDELDRMIDAHSVGWKTERMPRVDLAVLRLGLHELLLGREPVPVVINEAVELANQYCGERSGGFINGVLGAISREERNP